MKHSYIFMAGYEHLSCDKQTHEHRLRNMDTGYIEIWESCHDKIGIPYKNTHLRFKGVE